MELKENSSSQDSAIEQLKSSPNYKDILSLAYELGAETITVYPKPTNN